MSDEFWPPVKRGFRTPKPLGDRQRVDLLLDELGRLARENYDLRMRLTRYESSSALDKADTQELPRVVGWQ